MDSCPSWGLWHDLSYSDELLLLLLGLILLQGLLILHGLVLLHALRYEHWHWLISDLNIIMDLSIQVAPTSTWSFISAWPRISVYFSSDTGHHFHSWLGFSHASYILMVFNFKWTWQPHGLRLSHFSLISPSPLVFTSAPQVHSLISRYWLF